MKESHGEGVATHTGPESCAGVRKDEREALAVERAGRVYSPERTILRDAVEEGGRPHSGRRYRETLRSPARRAIVISTPTSDLGDRIGPGIGTSAHGHPRSRARGERPRGRVGRRDT